MNHTELISKLKHLVAEERRITSEILNHLRQVESLKLFALYGYPSLFEFCTKELGYSEGAAQRRISAMRLIKDLPEIESQITSGALSLSVISHAHTFFRKKKQLNKPMPREEKLDLLKTLEHASTRQCEKTLLELEPELATKDKERFITPEHLEIKITVNKEFVNNLETLKNLLSHQMPSASTKDIITYALNELLKRKNPTQKLAKKLTLLPAPAVIKQADRTPALSLRSRYIPTRTKKQVWAKSNSTCCYISPITGKKCKSQKYLEIDHIYPKSHGGSHQLENLQLLCDTHNRLKSNRINTNRVF